MDTPAKNQMSVSTATPNTKHKSTFTAAPKFVVTNRRSKAIDPVGVQSGVTETPRRFKRVESIQDPSSFEDSSQDLDVQPDQQTQQSNESLEEKEPNLQPQDARSPARKKQKTVENQNLQSMPYNGGLEPSTSGYIATSVVPRYLPPASKLPSAGIAPARPSFITPVPTIESVEAALPAIFSPHKKSQKFLPTGLASFMRSHIIEATSVHSQASSKPFNGYKIQIITSQRISYGSLVQAQNQTGLKSSFLLVGNTPTPLLGEICVLNGVNWSIILDEHPWRVVLDWKVER
jgi:hypothetical protein